VQAARAADLANVTRQDLRSRVVPRNIPQSEEYRTYFGRSLDMARIENAIRRAECGIMAEITDLTSESLSLDPHILSCAVKRFGAIPALDWTLTPASGPDVDPELAQDIADHCRGNLERIPCFGERLYDLVWAEFDGRAALELHWDFRSSKQPWWLSALEWIHPRRLSFNQQRDLQLIDTWRERGNFVSDGFRLADVPGKFLWWLPRLFREYPEREGLAPRSVYWAFFKRFSWRYRMVLTELFAVPWRIVTADADAPVSPEGMEEAGEVAEKLGQSTTAWFEPGIKFDTTFPHENSGQLFGMTNEDVDKQMSKLYLGQTGTTETDQGNRAGMIVAEGQQDIIKHLTGMGVSGRVNEQVVLPMTVFNYGPDTAGHAPRFELLTQPPRDREKEMNLAERAVQLQVPVAVDEIRDIAAIRKPDEDEAYVIGTTSGGTDAMGNPLPGGVKVVDPSGTEPKPDPTDLDDASNDLKKQEAEGVDGEADKADDEKELRGIAAYRERARAAGHELTDGALATLAEMSPTTRDAVFEAMIHGHA
jgi:phage gp29-like protein